VSASGHNPSPLLPLELFMAGMSAQRQVSMPGATAHHASTKIYIHSAMSLYEQYPFLALFQSTVQWVLMNRTFFTWFSFYLAPGVYAWGCNASCPPPKSAIHSAMSLDDQYSLLALFQSTVQWVLMNRTFPTWFNFMYNNTWFNCLCGTLHYYVFSNKK